LGLHQQVRGLIKYVLFLVLNIGAVNMFIAQNENKHYNKSVELYNAEKYKKSLIEINKAIEQDPNVAQYVSFKGKILYEINEDLAEFFSYLTKAIDIEPNSPIPLINRAYYYEQINEYQDAIFGL